MATWPHFGLPATLNTATHCAPVSSIQPGLLRGAVPGRASRQACGTYGADPARRAGPPSQQPLIARLIIALAILREARAVFPGVSVSGHDRRVKGAYGVARDRLATLDPTTAPQDPAPIEEDGPE